MKNIAIFQTELRVGGIEKSLLNLLDIIDYKKNKVDLYLFKKNEDYEDKINKNVNVIYLKPMASIVKFIPFNIVNFFTNNKIDKEYDISIDFNMYSPDTAINAIKVKSDKKIIWIHNDISVKSKNEIKFKILYTFFKSKFKYFDKYVAVSKGALTSFHEMCGITGKETDVIPNIISTDEIKRQIDSKTDFEVDEKIINICSVGRLVHQKGFDILINEFKSVIKENDKYHLYIIGDGEYKDNLINLISENSLDNYITLLGKRNDVYSVMNKCDALWYTSRYEGQGMVIMEAKSIGLDIIIPPHLGKYVDGIEVSKNMKKDILNLKKKKKKFDDLIEYNQNIKNKINNL